MPTKTICVQSLPRKWNMYVWLSSLQVFLWNTQYPAKLYLIHYIQIRPNPKELCSSCSEVPANNQLMPNWVHFRKLLPAHFPHKTPEKFKFDKQIVKTSKFVIDLYNKIVLWSDEMEDVFWNSFHCQILVLCTPVYRPVFLKEDIFFILFAATTIQEQRATGWDYFNI